LRAGYVIIGAVIRWENEMPDSFDYPARVRSHILGNVDKGNLELKFLILG